jgi:hypothetical protein
MWEDWINDYEYTPLAMFGFQGPVFLGFYKWTWVIIIRMWQWAFLGFNG